MIDRFLAKVFGTQHERDLKKLAPRVTRINALEPGIQKLSDEALRAKTDEFRARIAKALEGVHEEDRKAARNRGPGRAPRGGLRGRSRGVGARPRHASLRRPADRRHGPPPGQDRRDEDRRGQDPRRDDARLPERPDRPRRPRRDRERLPGPARRRVDGQDLPVPRPDGRLHPEQPARRRAQEGLRLRRHLRDQQRVRLRLPARQHEVRAREHGPARPRLRDRRRGRLDPHRRGPDAAHHLGPLRGEHRRLLPLQPRHPAPGQGQGGEGQARQQDDHRATTSSTRRRAPPS